MLFNFNIGLSKNQIFPKTSNTMSLKFFVRYHSNIYMSVPLKINVRGLQMVRVLRDDGDEVAVDESFRPGCGYIDVSFHRFSTVHVSDIRFSNHYSHRVMVLQQTTNASRVPAVGGGSEWKVAVPWKLLMPSPHCEEGAEDAFSLEEELGESGLEEVTRLRLYVQQPSALWRQFNLHNIQIFGRKDDKRKDKSVRRISAGRKKEGEGGKERLSRLLQHSMLLRMCKEDIEGASTYQPMHPSKSMR